MMMKKQLVALSLLLAVSLSSVLVCVDAEKDLYATLGLKRDANAKQIKRAFRKQSLKYHPDKNPGNEEAHKKFTDLSEAYDILSDEEKRAVYDIDGMAGIEQHEKAKAGGGGGMGPFGGMFGGGHQIRRGREFKTRFDVTLEDLYNGNSKTFRIKRKVVCPKCRGTGAKGGATKKCKACNGKGHRTVVQKLGPGFNVQMQQQCNKCGGKGHVFKHRCPHCHGHKVVEEEKELEAVIERGMADGHEIRFERAGEQTPGVVPGDVVLKINTRRHQRFTRKGDDLHHTMVISLREALLGFDRNVRHLDGRNVRVSRQDVTPHGHVMRLAGEGMPVHNFPSQKGQMLITFEVRFPKTLTEQQKQQIRDTFQ